MKRPGGIYIDLLHFVDRVRGHCQAQLDHKLRNNAKELDIVHRLIARYSRFFFFISLRSRYFLLSGNALRNGRIQLPDFFVPKNLD